MNFDKLEIYALEAIETKLKNQRELGEKLENDLTRMLTEDELTFPIEDKVLLNRNLGSFIYKNGKTYPHLIEFIAGILHVVIPIEIDNCKFGPGEIVVSARDPVEAHNRLKDCSHKLQGLIQAKTRS
jgi:hypothetical protein